MIYGFIRTLSLFCTGGCLQTVGRVRQDRHVSLRVSILNHRTVLGQQEPSQPFPGKRHVVLISDVGYQML